MVEQQWNAAIQAFVSLQLSGAIGFCLIVFLAEVVDRENTRLIAWRGFSVSWIVFGLSYSLLLLDGTQFSAHPDFYVCAIQASLVYAAPPLVANATLGLIIQLRYVILHTLHRTRKPLSKTMHILTVAAPWILWSINVVAILLYSFRSSERVGMNNNGTYCHLKNTLIYKIVAVWISVIALAVIGTEIFLVTVMHQHGFRLSSSPGAFQATIRVGLFMLQAVVCIGVAIVFMATRDKSICVDILIAIQPTVAAVIFGTKANLLCIWSKRKNPCATTMEMTHTSPDSGGAISVTSDAARVNSPPTAAQYHNHLIPNPREEV